MAGNLLRAQALGPSNKKRDQAVMIVQQFIELRNYRKPGSDLTMDICRWTIDREHSFNDNLNSATSQLLVCPACHTIWARLIMVDPQPAWPVAQTCEACTLSDEWIPVPGSLLVEEGWGIIDDSLLQALPEELLRREFDLHMRQVL